MSGASLQASVLLSARALACTYRGGGDVLGGVDLDLSAGELCLLVGKSASGKTSLVRCLNGLVPRGYRGSNRTGSVRVGGRDLADLAPGEAGTLVGTLLQDSARGVVGWDVWREIAFGPENLGLAVPVVQERVARMAERLGVTHLLARETSTLSGGELQKVALAGVLAMEPRVLLLDEPLAALDPVSAEEIALLLRSLADEGRALLVVEHRIEAIASASPDRVVELERGRVSFDGDLASYFARADPRHTHLPARVALARWRVVLARPRVVVVEGEEDEPELPPPPPPGAQAALEFEDVTFAYSRGTRRDVLAGVSLCVLRGERLALLGANGSGKSTLLALAMGLLRPDTGRVRVAGRDTAELSTAEIAREVGIVFQDPAVMLFADTVLEECRFGPRTLGLDPEDVERNVELALRRFHLEDLRASAPGALSIGQKKRVTLAAVAACGVTSWLVDEPTAGLDPAGVRDFLNALLASGAGASTVLFATHDLDLAATHAHRLAVLDGGRVAALGPPGLVLSDPRIFERARLRPTSLLAANAERLAAGLAPLTARALARNERGGGARA